MKETEPGVWRSPFQSKYKWSSVLLTLTVGVIYPTWYSKWCPANMYLHPKSYRNHPIINKNCQTVSLIHQVVLTTQEGVYFSIADFLKGDLGLRTPRATGFPALRKYQDRTAHSMSPQTGMVPGQQLTEPGQSEQCWPSLAAERNAPHWDADDKVKQNVDYFVWSP